MFVATLIIFGVLFSSMPVRAESESGSIGLEGRVLASAPTSAPVISMPKTDERFEESPITVSGTCESDLLIQIFVNEIFSGSVMCISDKYSIEVDILSGENKIIARAFDNLDQAGPDSNTVVVFLDIISDDLKLTSEFARKSANPNDELTWPIIISGGLKPYAIHIEWGDGRDSLKSVLVPGDFSIEHTYRYSGIYKVVVRAVDAEASRAILQLVAVSKGTEFAPSSETADKKDTKNILLVPLTVSFVFVISTFWLGVRYERKRIG